MRIKKRSLHLSAFVFFLIVILMPVFSYGQQATVQEELVSFKTYPFGDPDPVARMGRIYPYFRFDGFSVKAKEQKWKIISLENEYIRVLIAPEIGGKILGAFEKLTGRDFIYYNPVIKFRDVAMRGPWTSGGIEFNFGAIGHTPTTATPVDYFTRKNRDGSVSCFVGALDLASRTRWQVEIRLGADKAWFETISTWQNSSPYNTSFYHWMNGAALARDDLRYYFPGTHYIGHDGQEHSWPFNDQGKDLSLYGNNDFGSYKSYHVLGYFTDWFGGIYERDNFGFGHWTPYRDKPGKKIWIWGLSRQGMIWEDLLTDPEMGGRQYTEIQSGVLFNQAGNNSSNTPFKHAFFQSGQFYKCREIWFPVVGLSSMATANEKGALEVSHDGEVLNIALCPLERLQENVTVLSGGKEVYQTNITVNPLQVWRDSLKTDSDYKIILGSGQLQYTSEQTKLQHPLQTSSAFDWNTPYALFLAGEELARQRFPEKALDKYRAALEKDPCLLPALTSAAEIYLQHLQDEKALELVKRALSIDTYDVKANYLWGFVSKFLGKKEDACSGFSLAAKTSLYGAAANLELARLALEDSQYEKAILYAEDSRQYNGGWTEPLLCRAVALRRLGRRGEAEEILSAILNKEPLNHQARFESYLLEPSQDVIMAIRDYIYNEFPAQTFLEGAAWYLNINNPEEALVLLELAPQQPLVLYWQSYLSSLLGKEKISQCLLNKALESDLFLIFPFRRETDIVLKWASAQQSHWKTDYLLALLNWSRGQRDEALCLLEQWGDEPAFAPFYYTRAQLRSWGNKNDPLADLSKGQKMDRTWRGYFKMAVFLREMHDYEKALEWARQGEEKFPQNHIIQFEYARVLLYNRDYDQAIELLMDITILPHEGAQSGREVWRQACLLSALQRLEEGEYTGALARLEQARHWPENLGVGKPYKVDTRLEDFLQGYIFLQQKRDGAEPLLQQVVSYTKNKVKEFNVEYYIYILALEHLGKKEKAEALLNEWHKRSAQDRLADWVYHHYHKKGIHKEKLSFGGNTDFLLVEKISSIMDKIK